MTDIPPDECVTPEHQGPPVKRADEWRRHHDGIPCRRAGDPPPASDPGRSLARMARHIITIQLVNLRRDLPSHYTAGSDIEVLAQAVRELASDSLRLADATNWVENRGHLQVNVTIDSGVIDPGSSDPIGGDHDDPTGTLSIEISAGLPGDALYDFDNPDGPISAYYQAVMVGIGGAFGALPDPGQFFADIGVSDPAAQAKISRKVVTGVAAPAPEVG